VSGARSLRSRLLAGEQVVTALVRIPSAEIVEMLAVAGFDAVVIDCEHGPVDISALREHIALAQLHGMEALVRPGYADPSTVLRALDHGATGIVAPHIDSAAEARALVEAAHYPPLGNRGFATYSRAGRFGTFDAAEHRRRSQESTLVLAMIESPAAVRATSDILAVEGIDGFLVGTSDLAASSGQDDPTLDEALSSVRAAGRTSGAVRADLAGSAEQASALLAEGSSMVVYNLTQVLMGTFRDLRVHP
jgi:4-hydroxy-2-oxoheptanedioate aldolase